MSDNPKLEMVYRGGRCYKTHFTLGLYYIMLLLVLLIKVNKSPSFIEYIERDHYLKNDLLSRTIDDIYFFCALLYYEKAHG